VKMAHRGCFPALRCVHLDATYRRVALAAMSSGVRACRRVALRASYRPLARQTTACPTRALTQLAEVGEADEVIKAQIGHGSRP